MLKTLLGDHPVTLALKRGEVASRGIGLEFADVKVPHTAFKRVVRDLEFDVAELALMTFLVARAYGKPLRLVPAVLMARFAHPFLVHDVERGPLGPEDLGGKRIGLRSYSVTTGAWLRQILADDHGVAPERIRWVTFEDPHVAEFRDPPNAERAPAGKEMLPMLLAGELDAAILGEVPKNERVQPVIRDPAAAAVRWQDEKRAIQVNHMVVVKRSLGASVAKEVEDLLRQSRRAAGDPQMNPFGIEENRRNLEVAIDCAFRQRMIPRRFTVEELFE